MARITVHVTPRSRKNELVRDRQILKVRVTAPPVDGAANEATITLLARQLHLPKRALRIVQGASSRQKIIEIEHMTEEELAEKFRA